MAACKECRGTGLRGGDGTTPDHVGRLVTCKACKGTGQEPENVEQAEPAEKQPGELADPAIHTSPEGEADKPSILSRMTGGMLG